MKVNVSREREREIFWWMKINPIFLLILVTGKRNDLWRNLGRNKSRWKTSLHAKEKKKIRTIQKFNSFVSLFLLLLVIPLHIIIRNERKRERERENFHGENFSSFDIVRRLVCTEDISREDQCFMEPNLPVCTTFLVGLLCGPVSTFSLSNFDGYYEWSNDFYNCPPFSNCNWNAKKKIYT